MSCRAATAMLILLALNGVTRCAGAAESVPKTVGGKYGLETDFDAEYGPTASELTAGAWYRYIYHADVSPVWNGLYLQGGALVSVNPAYDRVSVYGEWMPLGPVVLRAQLDRYAFFGRSGSLLSYPDRQGSFGLQVPGRGHEQPGTADRLLLQPTLQGEFGRYVAINQASYAFYAFSRQGPYVWDQEYDTLLKKQDRLFADDLSLLYNITGEGAKQRLLVGPSYQVVRAMGADLNRERLGASLFYEPAPHRGLLGSVQHPRFYLQSGVNTRDRNRQGQAYVEGGVGADFDLN